MKIELYDNYQEAEERANLLLLSDSVDYPTLTTTKREINLPSPKCKIVTLIDEKSGNMAIIKRNIFNKRIGEDIESPEAWRDEESVELLYLSSSDEVIYPFRNLTPYYLVFPYLMRGTQNPFIKPKEEISPAEAQTVEGERKIRYFFGDLEYNTDTEENPIFQLKPEDIWQDWEDEDGKIDHVLGLDIRAIQLTKAMGKEIKSVEDSIEAITRLSGRKLTEEEIKIVIEDHYFYKEELFLLYCTYSFLRREQYSDLKKALNSYGKFGLKKDWSKKSLILEGDTPEYHIISRYYDCETYKLISATPLRELSNYTGIPLPMLLECSSQNPTKRAIRNRYKNK